MRQDIQCLRGIAIIFVFVYHLYPTIFVNGFLGVDIFFVISGYLMARNLTKNKLQSLTDFWKFYYRRFRRILHLYYLVIFISLIMVHLYLGEFWSFNSRRYSLASLFLVTNQLVIQDSLDYFKQFLADARSPNAFIHLWSLGVEMQFYLIVPFIFYGLQYLKKDLLKCISVTLMTAIGCSSFFLVLPQFAFNFMFLRLWQFSAGFYALFWNKLEFQKKSAKSENQSAFPMGKEDLVTIAVTILFMSILPSHIDVQILRPLVTLATAVVITCETRDNQFLKSETLVYIGNISYIIYLVHWPIISLFNVKTTFQNHFFVICE